MQNSGFRFSLDQIVLEPVLKNIRCLALQFELQLHSPVYTIVTITESCGISEKKHTQEPYRGG